MELVISSVPVVIRRVKLITNSIGVRTVAIIALRFPGTYVTLSKGKMIWSRRWDVFRWQWRTDLCVADFVWEMGDKTAKLFGFIMRTPKVRESP